MSRRFKKQFAYGLLYLAVLSLAATALYFAFVRAPASCENRRKDSSEEGVDCGGVCTRVCVPTNLRGIEQVGNVRILRGVPRTLEVLAKIQNANPAFAARSFNYRFNAFDANGALLDTVRDTSFIYGAEVKYLSLIKTGVAYEPASVELLIEQPTWEKTEVLPRPVLSAVQDRDVRITSSSIEIAGRISNKDVATLPKVLITAVLYDDLGIPLGVSETEISNLRPEETRAFTVLHPFISGVAPDRTEILTTATRP